MPDAAHVLMYCGRPVTELTREELIEALRTTFDDLELQRRWEENVMATHAAQMKALRSYM